MTTSRTAVADHATTAGVATTKASQNVATSIVPCTHQRNGTLSRSWCSASARGSGPWGTSHSQPSKPGDTPAKVQAVPDPSPDPGVPVPVLRLDRGLPLPAYAHPGDAGADLMTTVDVTLEPGERALVPTGISIALPEGFVALVHPRSGLAVRHGLSIVNTPGTIDAGYRGEIKVLLINHDPVEPIVLSRGDRIAQLVVQRFERARFVAVVDLPDSARGTGGYGSTGGFGPPNQQ